METIIIGVLIGTAIIGWVTQTVDERKRERMWWTGARMRDLKR